MKAVIVFQNTMNGGVAFSATGRGMWTVTSDRLTDGVRFAAASATAVHPLAWPSEHISYDTWAALR